jgi:hypothetical protein
LERRKRSWAGSLYPKLATSRPETQPPLQKAIPEEFFLFSKEDPRRVHAKDIT